MRVEPYTVTGTGWYASWIDGCVEMAGDDALDGCDVFRAYGPCDTTAYGDMDPYGWYLYGCTDRETNYCFVPG
ncbi:MAG: hypothetical protein ACI9K2_006050 [Myxococcota bacterium]